MPDTTADTTDAAAPLVSATPTVPVEDDQQAEYVATGPIYINGVRAYNEGDPVLASAVKNNHLQKFVKKA